MRFAPEFFYRIQHDEQAVMAEHDFRNRVKEQALARQHGHGRLGFAQRLRRLIFRLETDAAA